MTPAISPELEAFLVKRFQETYDAGARRGQTRWTTR